MSDNRVLRMGMVGGGRGAFIGAVHRTAACMDGGARFVAGCLSSTPDKALASGQDLGLDPSRNYATWRDMLETERSRPADDRIDFVSIVTPNHVHHEVALAFTRAGIHVVCDKPLVHTSAQARELVGAVSAAGTVFAVTYNYSGYPMVKHARYMVRSGEIGEVRKVIVEYNQGWLAGKLEETGQKQADWRTDPTRSGAGGAVGDIGSHAEQLTSYITGLEISAICADLTSFVPGRRLDDDANLLLRLRAPGRPGEARGVLIASQIEIGHENDLRIRIFGSAGSLEWRQEEPNLLIHRPEGAPQRVLSRGNAYLCDAAKRATRIPPGHPEAFLEAFANVYNNAAAAIRAGRGGLAAPDEFDFPGVIDGARGVWFIEKTVESAASSAKWTTASFVR
ncbi:MAG: Gfo/Idh/MocA family oxidoreductase [Phycisphaerae bacterium]|nr:Gfo/Idh/MocA family oxidoreductase [Phycisphaerae bacterium]